MFLSEDDYDSQISISVYCEMFALEKELETAAIFYFGMNFKEKLMGHLHSTVSKALKNLGQYRFQFHGKLNPANRDEHY